MESIICESSTSLLSPDPRGPWIVWARVESIRSLLGSSLNWDIICASSPLRCLGSTPTGLPPTLRAQVESTRLAFISCRTWTPSAHHPPIYLFLPARQGRTGYRTVCLWLVCLATTGIAGITDITHCPVPGPALAGRQEKVDRGMMRRWCPGSARYKCKSCGLNLSTQCWRQPGWS